MTSDGIFLISLCTDETCVSEGENQLELSIFRVVVGDPRQHPLMILQFLAAKDILRFIANFPEKRSDGNKQLDSTSLTSQKLVLIAGPFLA